MQRVPQSSSSWALIGNARFQFCSTFYPQKPEIVLIIVNIFLRFLGDENDSPGGEQ